MKRFVSFFSAVVFTTLVITACGRSSQDVSTVKLRSLTKAEAHADLSELVEKVRALYGPLEYKEARFGYKLDAVAADHHALIDSATTDEDSQGVFSQFLAKLDDAHVSITFKANSSGVASYRIPIFLNPIEDRAIVARVDASLAQEGIAVGDEIVAIDGVKPMDMLPTINKYRSIANSISNKQLVYLAFYRPFVMKELRPTSSSARVQVLKADGTSFERVLTWRTIPIIAPNVTDLVRPTSYADAMGRGFSVDIGGDMQAAAAGTNGMDLMGSVKPFFATPQVNGQFGLVRVYANNDYLQRYGLDPAHTPDIYAALYRYNGKIILLVRQPSYSHDKATEGFSNADYMNEYQAILDQYEPFVDGLVVDQTNNGGGSYCEDFFTLFIQQQQSGFVQRMNTDRKWVIDLHDWAKEVDPVLQSEMSRSLVNGANLVEAAYDAGKNLSEPIALMGGRNLVDPNRAYTWKKPFIVLINELSASCADAFPLLIKASGVAKLFGERTMGAGGNVEEVVQLSNSQAAVRMTRGLFSFYHANGLYPDQDFVENNGVQPDVPFAPTVADFRAGYVGYFDAFNKTLMTVLP